MTKTQQIQDLMKRKPEMSVAQIANKLKVSKVTVYAARSKMLKEQAESVPYEGVVVAEPVALADTKQVGGNHYTSLDIQPWMVIENNNMGFFDGNALKYIMRYRAKGGVKDLEKARHYIEKLIEMESGRNA